MGGGCGAGSSVGGGCGGRVRWALIVRSDCMWWSGVERCGAVTVEEFRRWCG